jgi:uncharacterized protein with PIN domain
VYELLEMDEQLIEVLTRFDLRKSLQPFSRCMECNGVLSDVTKEEIIGHLQPCTRKYYTEFRKCPSCERVYWEGSHYEKMKKFVDNLLSF